MARIEQRICDRCTRVDSDGTDHGWHELDVNGAQIDLCRGCSKDFILWVQASCAPPEDLVQAALARRLSQLAPETEPGLEIRGASYAPSPIHHPVVGVTRVDGPPSG